MKILLRQHQARLFYTGQLGPAQWSDNERQAMEFADCDAVETLCAELGFTDVVIVAQYGWKNETLIPVKTSAEIK